MNYLTTTECSKKWQVSSRMIAKYCKEELKITVDCTKTLKWT